MELHSNRRTFCKVAAASLLGFPLVSSGCGFPFYRGETIRRDDELSQSQSQDEDDNGVKLIGNYTVPQGMNYLKLEYVGLVNGLDNTGSDPLPSGLRSELIKDMQLNKVPDTEGKLRSRQTAMVKIRGFVPPGARAGDRFNLEVYSPENTETKSLRGGYLMPAQLREFRSVGDMVGSGHAVAKAQGSVIVEKSFLPDDPKHDPRSFRGDPKELRGIVPGGGLLTKTRQMGIVITPGNQSVSTSRAIATAINHRFHTYEDGHRLGVATAKRDDYIELTLHPRYRNDVGRYTKVIRRIVFAENLKDRDARLIRLGKELLEPITCANAAIELEGMDREAIPVLEKGLKSPDAEVRFVSAEALAYLDREEASPELAKAALVKKWRDRAIRALTVPTDLETRDHIAGLLSVPDIQTQYRAFQALKERNSADPLVSPKFHTEDISIHVVQTAQPTQVHFSRFDYPAVLITGQTSGFQPPAALSAGSSVMLTDENGMIQVTQFRRSGEDRNLVVRPVLHEVVVACASLGAGYGDIMEMLHEAKKLGYVSAELTIEQPKNEKTDDETEPEEVAFDEDGNPIDTDVYQREEPKQSFLGTMKEWVYPF